MAAMLLSSVWNSSMSTESSQSTDEPSLQSLPLFKMSRYLWYYVSPIILLFGNFGNVMTIIIMHRMKSGEAVFNIYFTALAIIDLVTLDTFLLFEMIGMMFGYNIRLINHTVCKIFNWITTSIPNVSGWCLVGLTTHRAVSVVWPHRVNLLCTRRLLIGLILGMVAFFAVAYSHYLYGYYVHYYNTTKTYDCRMMPGSYLTFANEVFTYIDMVLYSILPFICITFANSVLIWKLRVSVRKAGDKFVEKGSEQVAAREKAARSVTRTAILVSVAYVVLSLPASLYFISTHIPSFYASTVRSAADIAKAHLLNAITYLLMFSNFAVNFYLYCLTGQRFRKEFVKMFCPTRPQGASSG